MSGKNGSTVQTEQIGTNREDWKAPAWAFKNIHPTSHSAVSIRSKIRIIGQAESTCLPPEALPNGVMPQQTRQCCDFFAFAHGTDGGLIIMDLGQEMPVVEINSYSAQDRWAARRAAVRGTNSVIDGLDGVMPT